MILDCIDFVYLRVLCKFDINLIQYFDLFLVSYMIHDVIILCND